MKIKVTWEFDLTDRSQEAYDAFALENYVPTVIELEEYFSDSDPTEFQITDALSDDHGWLVQKWEPLYTVFVGGTEVVDHLVTEAKAKEVKDHYVSMGHDDVAIQAV